MAIKREKMKKNTGMESLYDVRLEKKIEERAGYIWSFMEILRCLRNYVTR